MARKSIARSISKRPRRKTPRSSRARSLMSCTASWPYARRNSAGERRSTKARKLSNTPSPEDLLGASDSQHISQSLGLLARGLASRRGQAIVAAPFIVQAFIAARRDFGDEPRVEQRLDRAVESSR